MNIVDQFWKIRIRGQRAMRLLARGADFDDVRKLVPSHTRKYWEEAAKLYDPLPLP